MAYRSIRPQQTERERCRTTQSRPLLLFLLYARWTFYRWIDRFLSYLSSFCSTNTAALVIRNNKAVRPTKKKEKPRHFFFVKWTTHLSRGEIIIIRKRSRSDWNLRDSTSSTPSTEEYWALRKSCSTSFWNIEEITSVPAAAPNSIHPSRWCCRQCQQQWWASVAWSTYTTHCT